MTGKAYAEIYIKAPLVIVSHDAAWSGDGPGPAADS